MTLADSLNVTMCPKLQQNRPVQKRFFFAAQIKLVLPRLSRNSLRKRERRS